MQQNTWTREDGYSITTDPTKLNFDKIHFYLSERAYWCKGIPREVCEKAFKNSVPFSIYSPNGEFVGMARVVTDLSIVAYLADVFVDENHRKKSLGKFLMETVKKYKEFQGLRRWLLMTKDAHGLYSQYGFVPLAHPERGMEITVDPAILYAKKEKQDSQ